MPTPATQPSGGQNQAGSRLRNSGRRASAALFFTLLACCMVLLILAVPSRAKGGPSPGQAVDTHGEAKPPPKSASTPFPTPRSTLRTRPERTGGPDDYGYVFADERDPGGPTYHWQPGVNRVPD